MKILVCIAFMLFTNKLVSQEENGTKEKMSVITITGTRNKKLLKDSVVKTEVLTKEDLNQMGARTIAEALGNIPGIEVRPAEAGQRGEIVRLQGLSAKNVLILVDGNRVTGRFNGAIDLTRFKIEDIERIEIVKGASSALYGSDAIAGVINIITKAPIHKYQADFRSLYGTGRRLYYGTGGEFRNSGSVGMKEESFYTIFTAGWHKGDGFDLTVDSTEGAASHRYQSQKPNYDPYPVNLSKLQKLLLLRRFPDYTPPYETTTGNQFQDLNVTNKTNITLGESSDLTVDLYYRYFDQAGVDFAPPRRNFDRKNKTHDFMGSITFQTELTEKTHLNLNVNASRFEDKFIYDQRGSDELNKFEGLLNNFYEFRSKLDFKQIENHTLSLGLESIYEDIRSPRIQVDCARKFPNICINDFLNLPPAQDSGTANRTRSSIYLQDEWKVFSKLNIIPGVRYEKDSQFGHQTMPKFSFRYDVTEKTLIRGSAGLGYRAPNFVELYYNFPNPSAGYVVRGNENLKPEISRSYNLGGEWEEWKRVWVSVNFFYNYIYDLISFRLNPSEVSGGLQTYETSNFPKVRTYGTEVSIDYKLFTQTSLGLGYTYTHSEDIVKRLPIEGVGFHRGNLNFKYKNAIYQFGFSLFAVIFGKQPFYCELEGLYCKPEAGSLEAQVYPFLPKDTSLEVFKQSLPQSIQNYCNEKNLPYCSSEPSLGFRMVNPYTNLNLRFFKKIGNSLEFFFGIDNVLEAFHLTYNPQRPRFYYFGINGEFKTN